jgi:hypothetical protein
MALPLWNPTGVSLGKTTVICHDGVGQAFGLKHFIFGKYMDKKAQEMIEKRRRWSRVRLKHRNSTKVHISATEIADFKFCPVSYSIKQTFELPKTKDEQKGARLHTENHLEIFLHNLLSIKMQKSPKFISNKWWKTSKINTNRFSDSQREAVLGGEDGPLLESSIVFKGHDGENIEPFMSKDGLYAGIPDFIFKHPNEKLIAVEVKHVFKGRFVKSPWDSHKVQLFSYLYGINFNSQAIEMAYLIYFHWAKSGTRWRNLGLPDVRSFRFDKNQRNRELLVGTYKKLVTFNNQRTMEFLNSELNINKCYNCSVQQYCNHFTGDKHTLELLYR